MKSSIVQKPSNMNAQSANNYQHLLEEIRAIALACGRNPDDITCIAVSKTHPWEEVLPLYEIGCFNFGENRIQEALEKIDQAPNGIDWHLIGPLQKNKVNKAIGKFVLIHSVDSIELAQKISQSSCKAGFTTSILIEVNTSGETTKHGFDEISLMNAFNEISELPNLIIDGLMTMAPYTENENVIRQCFRRLSELNTNLKEKNCQNAPMSHLSMGMSNDYRIAIEEGATLLRIGSFIFNSNPL